MRIAQQTHLVSVQLDRREIDLDLVELGYGAALAATCRRWSRRWSRSAGCTRTRSRSPARSPTGDPVPRRLAPAIRDRVLKLLLQAGIVEHVARGDWRIVNPLLQEYLRRLDPLG